MKEEDEEKRGLWPELYDWSIAASVWVVGMVVLYLIYHVVAAMPE